MADQVFNSLMPPSGRKRVKVYELRNADWYDRGTGFCTGQVVDGKALIVVESEDSEEVALLTSDISTALEGFQKQQDTLIVWTDHNSLDMALSFQEPEGCAAVWLYINQVQCQILTASTNHDDLSGEFPRSPPPVSFSVPAPHIQNLRGIDHIMRTTSMSPASRDVLAKVLLQDQYIAQLCPVFEMAEDMESLTDLHYLCNIVKAIILLNDSDIIESIVSDELIFGVVGMLEYDPDFPAHKANHRTYLSDATKFKEVIPIDDLEIKRKIHATYRLQYLKDVVLARILDDATFSVLNSLIFFNQLEVVQRLQQSPGYFKQLFGLFARPEVNDLRKKNAILLISQCCSYAKNLQPIIRTELWTSLVSNGLFHVIVFALRSPDPSVRIAGTEVFVCLIDHDTAMIRVFISQQILDKETPLTDLLIDMLLREVSHGVKVQLADAIKVLVDNTASQALEAKILSISGVRNRSHFESNDPEVGAFLTQFYEPNSSVHRLFKPLKNLEARPTLDDLTINEVSTFSVLIDLLSIFMKQHTYRSKFFILSESIPRRIAQLVRGPEKQLQLHGLKFFRRMIEHGDEGYIKPIKDYHLLDPILDMVLKTMPKNNLLNSAALEFFTYLHQRPMDKRKLALLEELVERHRSQIETIVYVPTFQSCMEVYDRRMDKDADTEMTDAGSSLENSGADSVTGAQRFTLGSNGTRGRMISRWSGLKDIDVEEQNYFDTSDEDDEEDELMQDVDNTESVVEEVKGSALKSKSVYPITLPSYGGPVVNGTGRNDAGSNAASEGRSSTPLVDYPDEDDDEAEEEGEEDEPGNLSTPPTSNSPSPPTPSKAAQHKAELDALRPKPLTLKSHPRTQKPASKPASKIPLKRPNTTSTQSEHSSASHPPTNGARRPSLTSSNSNGSAQPPERLSEKRRREENEEDDLSKHVGRESKRRSSVSSSSSENGADSQKHRRQSAGPFPGVSGFRVKADTQKGAKNEGRAADQTGMRMDRLRRRWSLNSNAHSSSGTTPAEHGQKPDVDAGAPATGSSSGGQFEDDHQADDDTSTSQPRSKASFRLNSNPNPKTTPSTVGSTPSSHVLPSSTVYTIAGVPIDTIASEEDLNPDYDPIATAQLLRGSQHSSSVATVNTVVRKLENGKSHGRSQSPSTSQSTGTKSKRKLFGEISPLKGRGPPSTGSSASAAASAAGGSRGA